MYHSVEILQRSKIVNGKYREKQIYIYVKEMCVYSGFSQTFPAKYLIHLACYASKILWIKWSGKRKIDWTAHNLYQHQNHNL